ncbi:rRNA maturation RNase YbeY [Treponema pedis]|uniref:Endoribonuclease YbeY n=2 Tax=Treponema pedis TaxID=409322 RepID=S5ZVI7_9SPIR|nr:rRNA maturation RNase YbeY [Treponema pedis]AGT44305.1 metalloprotease [Treponema pedis str. T A4]QOW62067.1 rRNA maturation RNase YbeY [Treponema pedis]QSI05007.1 rRNA maturation RNase YbeY [Treponema pedis]
MSNSVCVSFTGDEPPGFIPVKKIEKFVLTVLKDLKHENWDISILFCDDGFIRNLNKQYRNIDSPTDVLSFEQGDEYFDERNEKRFNAGDIIISLETLDFHSKEFDVGKNEELKRLLIHGILHLSGMNHSDNSPEQEMLVLQENLLKNYNNTIVYLE